MLTVGDGRTPLDRALLHASGGFLWWYVDLVDDDGNGLVLIWSFGLPFLPGYTSAAREGSAPPAADRPSLNVSVYEGGVPSFYLLQEYDPAEVSWEGDKWRFGRSHFERRVADGDLLLTGEIDCDLPATRDRLRVSFSVGGPLVHGLSDAEPTGHVWTPLATACMGTAQLKIGTRTLSITGRAYHDRNGSAEHLDGLDIVDWQWGRVPNGDAELIYYLVASDTRREVRVIEVQSSGLATQLPASVRSEESRRARFGMRWPQRMILEVVGETYVLDQSVLVDDGPFYLRFLVRNGEQTGIGERILPRRVDLALHRPFVEMAVHRPSGRNSFWLPLFCGPKQGRWSRLLGQVA